MTVRFRLEDPVTLLNPRVCLIVLEDDPQGTTYKHINRGVYQQYVTLTNPGDESVVTHEFTPLGGDYWNLENIECVALIQSQSTKEVYQAGRLPLKPDFEFAWDSPILSIPQGNGTAQFEGTLLNSGEETDHFTLELDNTFGWPTEFMVEGEGGYHTTPSSVALNPAEAVQIYMQVITDGEVRIGEGFLDVTSQVSERTQHTGARVFNGSPAIMMVEDDGFRPNEPPIHAALDAGGYLYDNWAVYDEHNDTRPAFEDMNGYDLVLWHRGFDAGGMDPDDEQALMDYMDTGGALIFSNQDFLSWAHTAAFAEDYLGVASYDSNVGTGSSAQGVPGDPITNGMDFDLYYQYGSWNRADGITPNAIGTGILNSDGYGIGVRADNGGARGILFSYGLNAMDGDSPTGPWPETELLILRSIDWVLEPISQAVPDQVVVSVPSQISGITPNPLSFNRGDGSTTIRLRISGRASEAPMSLDLVDLNGRLVRDLMREPLPAGVATASWNGQDEGGRPVGAGIYYIRFTTVEGKHNAKVVVLR